MKKYHHKFVNIVVGFALVVVGLVSGQGLLVSIGASELSSAHIDEPLDKGGAQ